MTLDEAINVLKEKGYTILEEENPKFRFSADIIRSNTVYEEKFEMYNGKLNGYWWGFSASWGMSKTDRDAKSQQFKVSAGKIGEPKTRKTLATRANYNSIFDLISDYLNQLIKLNEDFTQGVGAPLGADQGIPHSMQGCAVPMMRLGDPAPRGRIQRMPGPPPRHRMPLPVIGFWGGLAYTLVKPKHKKKKKKKSKKK